MFVTAHVGCYAASGPGSELSRGFESSPLVLPPMGKAVLRRQVCIIVFNFQGLENVQIINCKSASKLQLEIRGEFEGVVLQSGGRAVTAVGLAMVQQRRWAVVQ